MYHIGIVYLRAYCFEGSPFVILNSQRELIFFFGWVPLKIEEEFGFWLARSRFVFGGQCTFK